MQQATHPCLHVRDAHDAHVLFEAVRQGFLPAIRKRLNDMERMTLVRPGTIFVWVESEDDNGLKRWTDGRMWGQSRMREPYLFYDERLPDTIQSSSSSSSGSSSYRWVDSTPRSGPSSSALSHQDRAAYQHPGLVKQAYSAWVVPDPRSQPQKWHLTAYFTYAELSSLPTIDRDPLLQRIIVPPGIYKSGNARSRSDDELYTRRRSTMSANGSRTPALPSLQVSVPEFGGISAHQQYVGLARLPEDQRMIQMLNSRHVS